MKIQILNRFSGAVIFEYDCENNSYKITLEVAISLKFNLKSANLESANLKSANLDMSCLSLSCKTLSIKKN